MTILEKTKAAPRGGTTWHPAAAGDCVAGEVLVCEMTTDAFGDERLRLDLADQASGETRTVWCNAWLAEQLTSKGVKPGDEVGIRFDGKRKSPRSGNEYNTYSVVHESAGPA